VNSAGASASYVRDGCCTGPELACSATPATSPITLPLAQGAIVYFFVQTPTAGTAVSWTITGL
jgi:hypothetical protein